MKNRKNKIQNTLIYLEIIMMILIIACCFCSDLVIVRVCAVIVIVGGILSIVCIRMDRKNEAEKESNGV